VDVGHIGETGIGKVGRLVDPAMSVAGCEDYASFMCELGVVIRGGVMEKG